MSKYIIIENGKKIIANEEEATRIIGNFNKRNHIFSLDETWRTQKIIYLNDKLYTGEK